MLQGTKHPPEFCRILAGDLKHIASRIDDGSVLHTGRSLSQCRMEGQFGIVSVLCLQGWDPQHLYHQMPISAVPESTGFLESSQKARRREPKKRCVAGNACQVLKRLKDNEISGDGGRFGCQAGKDRCGNARQGGLTAALSGTSTESGRRFVWPHSAYSALTSRSSSGPLLPEPV